MKPVHNLIVEEYYPDGNTRLTSTNTSFPFLCNDEYLLLTEHEALPLLRTLFDYFCFLSAFIIVPFMDIYGFLHMIFISCDMLMPLLRIKIELEKRGTNGMNSDNIYIHTCNISNVHMFQEFIMRSNYSYIVRESINDNDFANVQTVYAVYVNLNSNVDGMIHEQAESAYIHEYFIIHQHAEKHEGTGSFEQDGLRNLFGSEIYSGIKTK
uniref:Uncharacterized protein n=1 Tax=Glossina brevipalpis TaxID=37001 RepID=A0A1A9WYS1_9MUSC